MRRSTASRYTMETRSRSFRSCDVTPANEEKKDSDCRAASMFEDEIEKQRRTGRSRIYRLEEEITSSMADGPEMAALFGGATESNENFYGEEEDNGNHEESHQFTSKIVDTLRNLGKIEVDAPKLSSSTRDAWTIFLSKFRIYESNGGKEKIQKLFQHQTQQIYADEIGSTLRDFLKLTSKSVIDQINKLHSIHTIQDYRSEFDKIALPFTTKYNRKVVENYMHTFSSLLIDKPTLKNPDNGGATEQNLVKCYIQGLMPMQIQSMVKARKPETRLQANKFTREALEKADIAMAWIELTKKCDDKNIADEKKMPQKIVTNSNVKVSNSTTTNRPIRKCFNCNGNHHFLSCPEFCQHSPGIMKHKYNDRKLCLKFQQYAKHDSEDNNTFSVATATTNMDNIQEAARAIASFTNTAKELMNYKVSLSNIILDSGANHSIANINHTDTIPIINRNERENVSLLSGRKLKTYGSGMLCNLPCLLANVEKSIVSTSQFCDNDDKYMLFGNKSASAFQIPSVSYEQLLNIIKSQCNGKIQMGISAQRDSNGLYRVEKIYTPTCNACFYTTNHNSISDIIRFFHESLHHPSQQLMCKLVREGTIADLHQK